MYANVAPLLPAPYFAFPNALLAWLFMQNCLLNELRRKRGRKAGSCMALPAARPEADKVVY